MRVPWYAWVGWIVMGLAFETVAIASASDGDTLTEYTVGAGFAAVGVGFGLWLAVHFYRRLGR